MKSDEMTLDAFRDLMNKTFNVNKDYFGFQPDGTPAPTDRYRDYPEFELQLYEVTEVGEPNPHTTKQGFELLFWGPDNAVLGGGAHLLENSDLGSTLLFLSPISIAPPQSADENAIVYQCIFQ